MLLPVLSSGGWHWSMRPIIVQLQVCTIITIYILLPLGVCVINTITILLCVCLSITVYITQGDWTSNTCVRGSLKLVLAPHTYKGCIVSVGSDRCNTQPLLPEMCKCYKMDQHHIVDVQLYKLLEVEGCKGLAQAGIGRTHISTYKRCIVRCKWSMLYSPMKYVEGNFIVTNSTSINSITLLTSSCTTCSS